MNFGGCASLIGPVFRGSDAYFVSFYNGDVFKLGLDGGETSDATKIGTVGPTLGWPVVGKDGKLYATRVATTGDFTTGAVLELDPDTGAVVREVASNVKCAAGMALDPLSGDLFVDDECTGAGADDPNIYRVRNPGSATPTTEVYATLPSTPNAKIEVAPSGTLYVVSNYFNQNAQVYRVSGTDKPQPATVEPVPGVTSLFWVNVAEVDQDGEAISLLTLSPAPDNDLILTNITGDTPTQRVVAHHASGGYFDADRCFYMLGAVASYELTDADGNCAFESWSPNLTLMPAAVAPNPAQGAQQTFTATLQGLAAPEGAAVFFQVSGANAQLKMVRTDSSGHAAFTYTATNEGKDVIVATADFDGTQIVSNKARVTWNAGRHVSFLSLDRSAKGGTRGEPVNVTAVLTDISPDPAEPVSGASVDFAVDGAQCSALTDDDGIATCSLAPPTGGMRTLIATLAETGPLTGASASAGFDVLGAAGTCGDANSDGSITATDALIVLRTAVGSSFCLLCICDVDSSSSNSASDALRVLRVAVGLPVTLDCPDCG